MTKNGFGGLRATLVATAALLLTASFGGGGLLRAEDSSCNLSTLTGDHGYSMTGYVYDRQGYTYYLAAMGVASADGAGNISGSETMSFDGSILKRKYTGTYTINADCTGSVTIQYADNSATHGDIVIVNDAKEVNFVQTDSGFIYSGVMKKQRTPVPAPTPTPAPASSIMSR